MLLTANGSEKHLGQTQAVDVPIQIVAVIRVLSYPA